MMHGERNIKYIVMSLF